MAVMTIRTPPDGNDVSNEFVAKFLAVLPAGKTAKEGLIEAAKQYVRRRKIQLFNQQNAADGAQAAAANRDAVLADPDLAGEELP